MRRLVALIPLSLLLAVACGDDSSAGNTPIPVDKDVAGLAESVCELAFRCCNKAEAAWFIGPYVDSENCAERFTSHAEASPVAVIDLEDLLGVELRVPNVAGLNRAVGDGRAQLNRQGLDACLEYIQGLACNTPEPEVEGCVAPKPPPEETPCAPEKIITGLVGLNGACSSSLDSLECADGLACRTGNLTGVVGSCLPAGDVGDPCVTDLECEGDLYCAPVDGTCQAYRNEGEPCAFADREDPNPDPNTALVLCRGDLSCDPITDTCVVACQRGSACNSDDDCDDTLDLTCIQGRCDSIRGEGLPCQSSSDCEKGLLCRADTLDPSKTICQARLALGATCLQHSDCQSEFCDSTISQCAAPLPAGSLCPLRDDAQCDKGDCVEEGLSCTSDAACPASGKCDLTRYQCASYCVALKPVGAMCIADTDCDSDACVRGFCRELPLATGEPCGSATECESEFCSLDDDPVCKELPLELGARCSSASQCDSGVCFGTSSSSYDTCSSGLDEGEPCGDSDRPPCNPKKFYCDTESDARTCVALRETGEICKSSLECRGTCTVKFNRKLCSAVAAPEKALCDGQD